MRIKCRDIMAELERLAPKYLAEDWDNIGLLVGSPDRDVRKLLVTLDVDQEAVNQAIFLGADMIIAHHPLIFKGITDIRTDLPLGSLLAGIIKHEIAVYAAHTNLDSAAGGVNDILAERLSLRDIRPLTVKYQEKLYKLVVFVPTAQAEEVRMAMTEAGAGHIGNYSHCTFQTQGVGTFLPWGNTNPFIGQQGRLEYVDECRIETIIPERLRSKVIDAMLAAHPYEEVAYDEYVLLNSGASYGLGRVGYLTQQVSLQEFVQQTKTALSVNTVRVAGTPEKLVKKVAVCGGSGASLIKEASQAGADVLVTGDVKYHEAQQAIAAGLAIIDAGHFATEQPVVEHLALHLNAYAVKTGWEVEAIANTAGKDIFAAY